MAENNTVQDLTPAELLTHVNNAIVAIAVGGQHYKIVMRRDNLLNIFDGFSG